MDRRASFSFAVHFFFITTKGHASQAQPFTFNSHNILRFHFICLNRNRHHRRS